MSEFNGQKDCQAASSKLNLLNLSSVFALVAYVKTLVNLARSNSQEEGYSLPISFGIAHLLEGHTVYHGGAGFVYGGCLTPWLIRLVVDWTINLNTLSSSSFPVILVKPYLLKNPQPPKSASSSGGQVFKHMRETFQIQIITVQHSHHYHVCFLHIWTCVRIGKIHLIIL